MANSPDVTVGKPGSPEQGSLIRGSAFEVISIQLEGYTLQLAEVPAPRDIQVSIKLRLDTPESVQVPTPREVIEQQ